MRKIPHWLEKHTPGESIDILRDLALSHARQGRELGHQIGKLIRAERFRELCELEFDYQLLDRLGYTAEDVYHCRQAVAFFTKLEHLDIGVDKEEVAFDKFVEAEHYCKVTNEVFRAYARGFSFEPRVEAWIFQAQRKIARVLGPVPRLDQLGYRFGKGATTSTKKKMASIREKFAAGAACSEEFFPMASALLGELPTLTKAWADCWSESEEELWSQVTITIVDGILNFVPKNAKTYRGTVTEPPLNGLFQLALESYLVPRLLSVGLDLRDQTRNQILARQGSLDGKVATIDLVSASDMKAKELVFHLLPLDWAVFLARGRTGHVTYRGERLTLEKFSSMGNGYTFPLESLIFWALTSSVCAEGEIVSVYGDDIICPSHRYADVTRLLGLCGFKVNKQKSYHMGPFRESCGKDYYKGIDVRPYYPKEWVSGKTLFTLHNFYVRRGYQELAENVKAFIHPGNLIFGPDGYGDGHLIGAPELSYRCHNRDKGYEGYLFDTFSVKGRKDVRPQMPSDFVLPSYSIYQRTQMPFEEMLPSGGSKSDVLYRARFLGRKSHGSMAGSEPIPSQKMALTKDLRWDPVPFSFKLSQAALDYIEESVVKATSLPIDVDPTYRRVSIYTLKRG